MKKPGNQGEAPIGEDPKSTEKSKHAEIKPDILTSEKDEVKRAEEKMRKMINK
jgi:hypothetical protein